MLNGYRGINIFALVFARKNYAAGRNSYNRTVGASMMSDYHLLPPACQPASVSQQYGAIFSFADETLR
jgi:hypothetical protein